MAKTRTEIQAKYDAVNAKVITIKLNRKTDADILEMIENAESKQGIIKTALRAYKNDSTQVYMCDAARDLLQEEADKQGKDVCTLAKLIISEWLVNHK